MRLITYGDGEVVITASEPYHREVIDQLIEWHMQSPFVLRARQHSGEVLTKEQMMQRMYRMELRTDFADPEKHEAIVQSFRQAAQQVFANVLLIGDGVKPDIMIESDDFYEGIEKIALVEDTIEMGLKQISSDGKISDELIDAFKPDGTAA